MPKELPIGKQSFIAIREYPDDIVYVDKTEYIYRLAGNVAKTPYFLSRPRRFGKSLLIDTIGCLFEGRKELFEGLYIYDKWDWEVKYPVIRIVFWDGFVDSKEKLQATFKGILRTACQDNHVEYDDLLNDSYGLKFSELIRILFEKTWRRVVVLVDEYDKPILDKIEDPAAVAEIRDELKGFYSVLKWADQYLRFVMITGVTKFSKVSVFSGLNNLEDITLDKRYNGICGYTLPEIVDNFWPEGYLEWVDIDTMRMYYNGYSFWKLDETLYNPFGLLNFFSKREYGNYWFASATPTFLIKLINRRLEEFRLTDLENMEVWSEILNSFDIDKIDLKTLLFQTGYLTIKETQSLQGETLYALGVPNQEVRSSLNNSLIQDYLQFTDYSFRIDKLKALHRSLSTGNVDAYLDIVRSIFAGIPYGNYTNNDISKYEGFYGSVLYAFMAFTGIEFIAEDFTNRWRIDFTLKYGKYVYIVELKVEATGKDAIEQIKDRKYGEKYRFPEKEIFLIGLNFDMDSRNVGDVVVETMV